MQIDRISTLLSCETSVSLFTNLLSLVLSVKMITFHRVIEPPSKIHRFKILISTKKSMVEFLDQLDRGSDLINMIFIKRRQTSHLFSKRPILD